MNDLHAAQAPVTTALEHLANLQASATGAARVLTELLGAIPPEPPYHAPLEIWPYAGNDAHPFATTDASLWKAAPVLCVPKLVPFEAMESIGHRFLAARDGLWIEVRRPWLHLVYPIARSKGPVLPFGELEIAVTLPFGRDEQFGFIRDFTEQAQMNLPNEIGRWASWEHGKDTPPRLVWSDDWIAVGTPAALVDYRRPEYSTHYAPCFDIHSHGAGPAGFSSTDNEDDAGDVKIAVVVGNVDKDLPTIAARLCVLGLMIPVPISATEVFA